MNTFARAPLNLLCSATLLTLVACNPSLYGECQSQDDCREKTVCYQSVCVHPDLVPQKQPPKPPDLEVITPARKAALGLGVFEVEVKFRKHKEYKLRELRIELISDEEELGHAVASQEKDVWKAKFEISSDFKSGGYHLRARGSDKKGKTWESPLHPVFVDLNPPTLSKIRSRPPERSSQDHPALAAFVLGEEVVIDVDLQDEPAGVEEPPTLKIPAQENFAPVKGKKVEDVDGRWRFRFNSRLLQNLPLSASFDVEIEASDAVGNTASHHEEAVFRVDRLAFRWRAPNNGKRFTNAPVIVGPALVLADKQGNLFAIDRESGKTLWHEEAKSGDSALVGHLSTTGDEFFALRKDGVLHGWRFDPDKSEFKSSFECPGPAQQQTPGTPMGGLALLLLPSDPSAEAPSPPERGDSPPNSPPTLTPTPPPADGGPEIDAGEGEPSEDKELLLAYFTQNEQLRLVKRHGSWGGDEAAGDECQLSLELKLGQLGNTPPVLHQSGGKTRLFVTLIDGSVVALSLEESEGGVEFKEDWRLPEFLSADPPPLSLALRDGEPILLAVSKEPSGIRSARMMALDLSGNTLWTTPSDLNPEGLRPESPALSSESHAYLHSRDGRIFQFALSTGELVHTWQLPPRYPETRALSMVLGRAHTLLAASGTRVSELSAEESSEGSSEQGGEDGSEGAPADHAHERWALDTLAGEISEPSEYLDRNTLSLACDGSLFVTVNSTHNAQVLSLVSDSFPLGGKTWSQPGGGSAHSYNFGSSLNPNCP